MEVNFYLRVITLKRVFTYLTYVLATFPVLTYGIRSVTMILWSTLGVILWGLNYTSEEEIGRSKKNSFTFFIISVSPFLYLVMSLFYSDNFSEGLKNIVQMLSLLIFPLIFYLNRNTFSNVIIKKIIWIFCFSVVIFVLYQIINSLFNIDFLLADLTKNEIKSNNLLKFKTIDLDKINALKTRRFRNYILELVDTHFTYQGLWISFIIFIFTKEASLRFKKNRIQSIALTTIAVLCIIWLLILSTRMPLISILIASTIFFIVFYKIKLKKFIMLLGITIALSISSYFAFIPFQVRMNEIFMSKFDLPTKGNDIETYNSVNVRNGIYLCSFEIIKKNFLLGVGIGDCQDKLNECYNDKIGAKIYTWSDYNTHNQYLFFLISTGIGGFFVFLLSIYIHLKESIIQRRKNYFYFTLIIILISITENILVRSDGVMFYAFFGNLFLFNSKK